jgi:hypothetical protein
VVRREDDREIRKVGSRKSRRKERKGGSRSVQSPNKDPGR